MIQPHATTHDELPVTMPHTMEDSKMPRSKLQGGLRVREAWIRVRNAWAQAPTSPLAKPTLEAATTTALKLLLLRCGRRDLKEVAGAAQCPAGLISQQRHRCCCCAPHPNARSKPKVAPTFRREAYTSIYEHRPKYTDSTSAVGCTTAAAYWDGFVVSRLSSARHRMR